MVLGRCKLCPGAWVGALLVHIATGNAPLASIAIATGNTAAAAAAAMSIRRFSSSTPNMSRVNDILWFLAVAAVGCTTISATAGVTTLCTTGSIPWTSYGQAWATWWLGDATGVMLVAPPIISAPSLTTALRAPRPRQIEALALALLTILVSLIIFGAHLKLATRNYPLTYMIFPPLLWAAMRFGLPGGSIATLVISILCIWGTTEGLGPFPHDSPTTAIALVWTFTIFISAGTLLLATLFTERRRVRQDLQDRLEFEHLITTISNRFVNMEACDTDREIQLALEQIGRFCDVDRSYLFQLRENATIADNTHEWCSKHAKPEIDNLQNLNLKDAAPWMSSRLLAGDIVHIPSVSDMPPDAATDKALLQQEDILSVLVVPMTTADSTIGFLGFDSVRRHQDWTNETITLLKLVGEILTGALQRCESERALRDARDQLENRVKERTRQLSRANDQLKLQIDERRKTEEELDRFFNTSTDMHCIAGTDGYFKRINPAFEKTLGHTTEQLMGRPFTEYIHPDDRQRTTDALATLEQGQTLLNFDNRYLCVDGSYRYLRWTAIPYTQEQTIYATARDVTDQINAQRALQQSEQRFRNLFANSPVAIWREDFTEVGEWLQTLRSQGINDLREHLQNNPDQLTHAASLIKVRDVNRATLDLYKAASKEQLIEALPGILQQESHESILHELLAIWHNHDSTTYEATGKNLAGDTTHKLVKWATPHHDGKQDLANVVVVITDITALKHAEMQRAKLLEREQLARADADSAHEQIATILESITDAFVALDNNWCYTYVNERAGKIFNRNPASLIGKHIWTEFPEGVGQPFHKAYLQAAQTRKMVRFEEYYPPWDAWYENRVYPSPNGLSIFFQDITKRVKAVQGLRTSEERFRLVTQATHDAIYDRDIPTDTTWLSDRFEEVYGVSQPMTHDAWARRVHPEDRDRVVRDLDDALNRDDQTWSSEYRFALPDGGYAYVIDRAMIARDKHNKPTRVIGALADVTEQVASEKVLRQSERLASIGTFAAGIAHEINNPLGAILLNAQYAVNKITKGTSDERLNEALSDIRMQAQRASEIVKGILKFSRQEEAVQEPEQLADALQNAQTFTRTYAQSKGIAIDLDVREQLPPIRMNRTEIEQVFVNLIKNAIDASSPNQHVRVNARMKEGEVSVTVQDDGTGMSNEQIKHAFDPFYSTRHGTGGTGLGLSISHGIINQHQGHVEIKSTPNQGTTITVTLPALQKEDRQAAQD